MRVSGKDARVSELEALLRMAEGATRMVLRLRDGERPDNPRLDLATSLVVRQSTAAPAGDLVPDGAIGQRA